MKNLRSISLLAGILALVIFASCDKDDARTEFEIVNDWIYEEMDTWYLWTNSLPEKTGTAANPYDFFRSLLAPQDHFSFMYDNYEELVDRLNGITLESGFEYKLYRESEGSSNVIMQIVYIKKGSPADLLGLKRGDIIYKINGVQFTDSNYEELLNQTNEPYEADYRSYNPETEEFEERGTISISPVTWAENPILLDTTYEIGGKKIGYLIYTFFSPGPTEESNVYDEQVDAVFGAFRSEGISEFILDLRFNSGGSEVSARNLASLLANANSSDIFLKKQYNDYIQDGLLNDDRYGPDFLNITFNDEPQNISQTLSSNTVYVITSNRSASASEVVINSLLPFTEVFIVGDTTVGKDVGSITLNDPKRANNWAIQPIVVKIVNADNQDYPAGFRPDLIIEDKFLILKPLGDIDEPLLSTTLGAIGVQAARIIPEYERLTRSPFYESIERKVTSGKFIMEKPANFQE